jgi:ubiquitin-like protein Pup
MADQTRKPKPKKDEEQAKAEATETTESKTEEIDDLLDEIDEVLEVNSEEFVRSFIQKGGQAMVPLSMFGATHSRLWVLVAFGVAYGVHLVRGMLARAS